MATILLVLIVLVACATNERGTFTDRSSGTPGSGARAPAGNRIPASDCTATSVRRAIGRAADGDTVAVPAGTCSWTSTLTVTKGITIAGAGIDQTILLDNVPRDPGGNGPMLVFEVPRPKRPRLTGITFRPGKITQASNNGNVIIGNTTETFRVDHVKFDDTLATAQLTSYDATGVIDHCEFLSSHNSEAIRPWHQRWKGGGEWGDNSWAQPTNLGTAEAVYIEDNVFTVAGAPLAQIDSQAGGRVVVRRNTFRAGAAVANHGTESSQRYRSARSFEVYENTFECCDLGQTAFAAIFIRGGTGVIFNNTLRGYAGGGHLLKADTFRVGSPFVPWGQCTGKNPWDGNAGPAGYPCLDQPGRGPGDLLRGDPPVNSRTRTVAWPRQAPEPIYVWGNTLNGADVVGGAAVEVGRDILLTPKPGYTPFCYPHPLVSGTPCGP
jgi:hypothetical protein